MDLFGRASEEKEVNQIVGKVLEARATRSFDTFRILSKYVSERYLLDILLPMKEVQTLNLRWSSQGLLKIGFSAVFLIHVKIVLCFFRNCPEQCPTNM